MVTADNLSANGIYLSVLQRKTSFYPAGHKLILHFCYTPSALLENIGVFCIQLICWRNSLFYEYGKEIAEKLSMSEIFLARFFPS